MDRHHELELLRRSIVMLTPGVDAGLSREQALELFQIVRQLQAHALHLAAELRRLADEAERLEP
jgi:hypothetical protein